MAFDTLWQHKLRSFLTILGVVIGTMTVIVIAAFVSGIDSQVAKEIESFGTNSIYIFKFNPGFNFNPTAEERQRKPISYEDAMAIRDNCPSVVDVAPFMSPVDFLQGPMAERVKIRHGDIEMVNATVQGTLPAYFRMGNTEVTEGRFFTDGEN
ncbi:MAG TPA: ABC transporter permease, partial [Blastocatellia bacterium]|nr:ABC transporter permease [Blastocatellia bacterium]